MIFKVDKRSSTICFAWLPTKVNSYDNSFHMIWIWWEKYELSWRRIYTGKIEYTRTTLNPKYTLKWCRDNDK